MSARAKFMTAAKPINISLTGSTIVLDPKWFSTDSVGWNANGKVNVQMPDGSIQRCQLGLNLTVVGSKEWPAETKPAQYEKKS